MMSQPEALKAQRRRCYGRPRETHLHRQPSWSTSNMPGLKAGGGKSLFSLDEPHDSAVCLSRSLMPDVVTGTCAGSTRVRPPRAADLQLNEASQHIGTRGVPGEAS